ncbi:MAG TPA: serine hydrolase, partial [Longimicrobiales bacterium]|nr:serine hydrolase [Longimicrobiales bacterium]
GLALLAACRGAGHEGAYGDTEAALRALADSSGAEVAVYYRSLDGTDSLLLRPDLRMHAASTMKVPVMIQLFRDADAGRLDLDATVEVTTTFRSIVDGSPYELPEESDSDSALYRRSGKRVPMRELVELMITRSSNLATNLLIREADARRVTATMRELGADSMEVLRGVEDLPAFRAGMNNTTTARDLGAVLTALGTGRAASEESTRAMLEILGHQEFRSKIPAGLPPGTRVANKTGRITAISHDAALVFPEGAPAYVLVVLTRGFDDPQAADEVVARISGVVYRYHMTGSDP